ncbi:bifunctional DNA-formamidopyrimidine glycosylase/DNA-(apurinic or apyrimidinic site) lyase [Rickettsiales bacterium]|nr:bifunctional DNA-formamidopyrimidine glycosylase/DNA-(apurinic or apyrimidinic site) lyase [Rickettsiales bacterium]MDB2550308.1 bifunctional DNA-formamidopyrimidine glycosylase/DNA-(apurinic or apyrimidinic site) lyase [Rickettsiales bacterium]
MPELPEVETVCRGLQDNIINKKIINTQISDKNLRFPYPKNFTTDLNNSKIINISRRARYILIELDNGRVLLIHLGMTGKLNFYNNYDNNHQKHDHIIIKFSDNSSLKYNDARRFGFADLFFLDQQKDHKMLKHLAIEPLSDDFNAKYLQEKLKNKSMNIKNIMMDNKIVVGVGNIYINESLFLSKISPLRSANKVKLVELKTLIINIKNILQRAIDKGGSTLRDYKKLNGDIGNFQFDFKIYAREGKECVECGNIIKRIKQNGRSSFFCDKCQK